MTFVHQHLEEIDSTNSALWELSEKVKLTDFHTISADYQWSGKGQETNTWHSEKAQNILFSTLVFPDFLAAGEAFKISQWVSLSIFDFLTSHGLKEISIKWPNDIYVGHKKIAGILIQNAISGSVLEKSLVGIGFNLNEKVFPNKLPNPVSLAQLVQQDFQILEESLHILSILRRNYELLKKNPQKILKQYHKKLFKLNEWSKFKIVDHIIEAKITGVDEFGRLRLENRRGVVSLHDLKEISFILE